MSRRSSYFRVRASRSNSIRAPARGPSTTFNGSPPSAQVVANAFVHQFYHILHRSPHYAYRFYQEISKLGRRDPNGVMGSVTTMQAINNKLLEMDNSGFRAEIKTVDAQDSHDGGVTVLVTGSFTGKDMVKKNFTQSFFLAPQTSGYFILNDIIRVCARGSSIASDESSQSVAAGSPAFAQVHGNAFVQQFYHMLHQSPRLVFQFYKENSKVGRPDRHGVMDSVSTIQGIKEKTLAVDCSEFNAELKTVDTQESLHGGLIVLVTGYLTGKDFAQSFFLAPQDGGYFVLNDIFRYVDEDAHPMGNVWLANVLPHQSHRNENNCSPAAPVGAAAPALHLNSNSPATTHPPIPEDVQLAMAIDASIQSAIEEGVPVDLDVPDIRSKPEARVSKEGSRSKPKAKDSEEGSSNSITSGSCVICLDVPVEGACIPCGHMAGCMSCLNEIQRKKWGCPVCRAKIDQVVRIYTV